MKVIETKIPGVLIVETDVFGDHSDDLFLCASGHKQRGVSQQSGFI